MPAAIAIGVMHDEAEFSTTVLVEVTNSLIFAHKVLEYRKRLGDPIFWHSRKIWHTDDTHDISDSNGVAIPVKGLVWFHWIKG